MAPKAAPTFTAPDGTVFTNRASYRDYMMATYYSFKNVVDAKAPLIKGPGEVDGQVFDMSQCTGSTLVVMDRTEAVQIDHLSKCRVFIGCCVSSIFIRNCDNCVFYTSCRQLRLREVTNSQVYAYSQAEVHIEQCTGMAFAPFNGGYTEQAVHFKQANINPGANLWWDIFDHNDQEKSRKNWRLLQPDEFEPAWFPQGTACTPCVPITAPGTQQDDLSTKNQVGEAHGMDKLRADAAKLKAEAVSAAAIKLNMESALLVASALGKGINVSVWLTENGGPDGKIPAPDFNAKLVSMGLVVGVEEDWDTKRELEAATAKSALKNIAEVCGKGKDKSTGVELIDVKFFIDVAQAKVAAYLEAVEGNDPAPSPSPSAGLQKEQLDELVFSDDVAFASTEVERPKIACASPLSRVERGFAAKLSSPSSSSSSSSKAVPFSPFVPPAEVTETIIPDSPYDEEVAFDLDQEEEAATVLPYGAHKSTAPQSFSTRQQRKQQSPQQQNQRVQASPCAASPSKSAAAAATASSSSSPKTKTPSSMNAPRPSSAGPSRISPRVAASRPTAALLSRSMSAGASASSRASMTSNASSVLRSSLSATATKPFNLHEDVEMKTRRAIRHTDLFHLVQVHLGFIDAPYRIVPPRGPIITSVPRPWLTLRDIKDAFAAARENLNDVQAIALMKNVLAFASSRPQGSSSAASAEEVMSDEGEGSCVASVWLKQYLVHLRLTKKGTASSAAIASTAATAGADDAPTAEQANQQPRANPLQWSEWLSGKINLDEKSKDVKPKEFRRALAGRAHSLSAEETAAMLESHVIVPPDALKKEVSQLVRAWALDMDGRMDFLHRLNVEKRKYLKEASLSSWKQVSAAQRAEVESRLRKKIVAAKSQELLESERAKAALTKALFAKFERFNKSQKYAPLSVSPWGAWLEKHQTKAEEAIKKFRAQAASREKATEIRRRRGQAVAPLADVQAQLLKAADGMKHPDHAIELRKSLVALRRAVMVGKSGAALVSKQVFEKHLDKVLAPRLSDLPADLRALASEARRSHDGLFLPSGEDQDAAASGAGADALFGQDEAGATARCAAIEAEKSSKKDADFGEWVARKEAMRQQAEEKEVGYSLFAALIFCFATCLPPFPHPHTFSSLK
jgi:hypothetical protein